MNKEYLKNIILDQREQMDSFIASENLITREGANRCRAYLSHPNVLLISGMRRAGKSVFSHLLARRESHVAVNFDDERLLGFKAKDFNVLMEAFYELYDEFQYVVFDEIQNISGWELFINRLRLQHRIIVTGSNARLLSSEMATHLTGRFDSFTIFPMSFSEYLRFHSIAPGKHKGYTTRQKAVYGSHFEKYLRGGGIFEYYRFGKGHIRSLFSSIVARDILSRYAIKYPTVLEELALYLINTFASKLSVNRAANMFHVKSQHTIREYVRYLENVFLIVTLGKFSYKLKEQRAAFQKVYVIDNGFIESLTFDFSENRGRLLENVVAVELKRRSMLEDFEIYYWDNYVNECDFVIKSGRKITSLYQVCFELTERNRQRELAGLVAAAREFKLTEGTILTMSQEDAQSIDGISIKVVPVWKWMLHDSSLSPS